MVARRREHNEILDALIKRSLHALSAGVKPSSCSWIQIEKKLRWLQVIPNKRKILEPQAVSLLSVKAKGFYIFVPGLFLV